MKIVSFEDKITVYIYKQEEISDTNEYIKKLILKLKRKYKISINGFYETNIYKNKKIGMIIDIVKNDIDYFCDLLDLKINTYDNADIYFSFDDYFFETKHDIIYLNDKYYLDIKKISTNKLFQMIEFSNIVYGEELEEIKKKISCLNK